MSKKTELPGKFIEISCLFCAKYKGTYLHTIDKEYVYGFNLTIIRNCCIICNPLKVKAKSLSAKELQKINEAIQSAQ